MAIKREAHLCQFERGRLSLAQRAATAASGQQWDHINPGKQTEMDKNRRGGFSWNYSKALTEPYDSLIIFGPIKVVTWHLLLY